MKTRVCQHGSSYYVQYYKWLIWWNYEEDFIGGMRIVWFNTKQEAIIKARSLSETTSTSKVVWKSE